MKTNFNSAKVIVAALFVASFFGTSIAQTKKTTATKTTMVSAKPTQNFVAATPKAAEVSKPVETKSSPTSPKTSASSSSKSLVPQSSFVKGSKYIGGGASVNGSAVAINLSAEYGITNDISVGGVLWYATNGGAFSLGLSADYHLARLFKTGNIDPYLGVSPFYSNEKSYKIDDSGNTSVQNGILRVVAHAGVNYYLSPKTIIFAQYSVGIVNGGNGYPSAGIKFAL